MKFLETRSSNHAKIIHVNRNPLCVWACACLCVFACVLVRACVSLRFCLPAFSNMLKAPVPMGDSCNTLLGSSPRHLTDLMSVSFSCSIGQCSVVFVLPASSLLSVYVHHSRWLACPGLTVASSKNKSGCPYRHYKYLKNVVFTGTYWQQVTFKLP